MSKKDRLMEILELLMDEFPALAHIAVDDLDNPEFVFIGDYDNFEAFTQLMGVREEDGIQALFDSINGEATEQIGWDGNDDDDNGGGFLQ